MASIYSTPPRSNIKSPPSLSFRQPTLLSSSELKRRFSPIHSSNKKRRYDLLGKTDRTIPSERNLNMPMILPKLFDTPQTEESSPSPSRSHNDCVVPLSSSIKCSKIVTRPPMANCLINCTFKTEQENCFSISESILRQKLQLLLEKN